MKDYLIRGLAFNGEIRFFVANTTKTVETIRTKHNASRTAIACVGRTATITAILGAMQKSGDAIDVRVKGGGSIGAILANSDDKCNIRAYATNMLADCTRKENGKLNVSKLVGTSGEINVIKYSKLEGSQENQYVTTSPIVSGEIAEDFTYYFAKSEQIPTATSLGVLVDDEIGVIAAGGFVVQVMPFASEESISKLEKVISTIAPISKLIQDGLTPENIAEELFGEDYKILSNQDINFYCNCSKEKYEKGLITLGIDDLTDLLTDEITETVCSFCNSKYEFTKFEIQQLIEKIK